VDAAALGAHERLQGGFSRERSQACWTKDAEADGEVVWFRRSKAGVKFCGGKSAQPGFRQNHIRWTTVAKQHGHRGEHEGSR